MDTLLLKPIEEIVPKAQKLITIDSTVSVFEALELLSSKNIYSAPVKDKDNGSYYGFLDLVDVVVFLVQIIEEKSQGQNEFKDFVDIVKNFNLDNAKNIADLSSSNPLVPLRGKDNLGEALKIFESTGTHRIPILKEEGVAEISNVLTQVDVIAYLASNIKNMGAEKKKKLSELNVQPKKLVSVNTTTRTLDAFKLMVQNHITAVPILNEDGTLLSNLSAKDIKEIKLPEMMMWMNKSVLEFVQMVRSKQINVTIPIFSCHLHNTLEEILMKLNVLRVHRLYINDENNKPIGVLSLGDLLKLVSHSTN